MAPGPGFTENINWALYLLRSALDSRIMKVNTVTFKRIDTSKDSFRYVFFFPYALFYMYYQLQNTQLKLIYSENSSCQFFSALLSTKHKAYGYKCYLHIKLNHPYLNLFVSFSFICKYVHTCYMSRSYRRCGHNAVLCKTLT